MQDVIQKEITVKATQERVYTAITDPKQLITWFPDAIEGNLEVGEQPVFDFGSDGKTRVYIVDAKPFSYFAYRWVPGHTDVVDDVTCVANTLVEFFLEPTGDETKVTLKESGFSALPAEVAEEKFSMNNGGWDYMLDRFEKVMQA
jgi:uncharacterized protein YndB with AHSA1/START domain